VGVSRRVPQEREGSRKRKKNRAIDDMVFNEDQGFEMRISEGYKRGNSVKKEKLRTGEHYFIIPLAVCGFKVQPGNLEEVRFQGPKLC